jgi:hypothetical protein
MKKTLLCLAICISTYILMQPKYSHGSTQQPPLARTGAPGEMSCASSGCHSGVATANSPNISIDFGGGLSTYQAGVTYQITIANSAAGAKYGFEMVALDNNGDNVGVFTGNSSQNTKVTASTSNGRSYVHHFNATTTAVYTFQWQAPPTNVGIVTFYAACNAANGNALGTGDFIHLKQLAVDFNTAIGDAPAPATKNRIITYPNPLIGSDLFVAYRLPEAQNISLEIYDLNGKLMEQRDMGYVQSGEQQHNLQLDRSQYSAGNYILCISGKTYNQTHQISLQ